VSAVIDAINWSIKNKDKWNIRIINLSLGHPATTSYSLDPMAKAVERAVKAGIVVCASAGNLGKTDDGTPVIGGIVSPGYTPGAVTVGALNTHGTVARDDDGVATYSSRGPVGNPDVPSTWEIKPDLVAPGNAIVSVGSPSSYLWSHYPTLQVYGSNGGTYLKLSGASMATAVTSGAVAQILQANSNLSPAEVKFALQYSAQALPGFGLIEQGAGSLDVPMAVAVAKSSNLTKGVPGYVMIGGEQVTAGHVAFGSVFSNSDTIVWGSSDTIVWGSSDTIVWGSNDTIVWGSTIGWGRSAIWGSDFKGNTVYWGGKALQGTSLKVQGASDTIVWGSLSDTIVWGSLSDTIVWGSLSDTIVWGSSDTIVWGSSDTIVWGSFSDTIVWGSFSDTIVWGSSDTIVWGSFSDTIVWGSSDTIVWGSRSCDAPPDGNGEQRPCSGG
jgi:serine protease AprX